MPEQNIQKQCPVCDSNATSLCIRLAEVPIYCNVLYPFRESALTAPKGDISLMFCQDCGHLFNGTFDAQKIAYSAEYDNSLHYSGRFREYAESLARDLVERYDLHGKKIVEIACGKGDFLADLCQLGQNLGYGFDPSYEPNRQDGEAVRNMTIVQDYYSERYANLEADLVCCRHALEHIEKPKAFLNVVRTAVTANKGTALYFEVPNSLYTLKDMGIWDIIYEHCGYFCQNSLARVFIESGFSVQRLNDSFGGQFLSIETTPADGNKATPRTTLDVPSMATYAQAFEKNYEDKVTLWKSRLKTFKEEGKRVVVWGAGSKGVTFLNVLKVGDEVESIVDLNVHKHGKYVPGTGHPVVSPSHLQDYRPDVVIVMNPIYANEITQSLKDMGVKSDIITE
ncbi:MAG: class I SAM-dependent methyltransferase [Gammaproteobacteria bacterium]